MRQNSGSLLIVVTAFLLAAGMSGARADNYVVTNVSPSGPGSLAQAIIDSNQRPGPDSIVFNIPGSGVQLIDLSQSFLPEITDPVVIDGYTQPGAHPNTLSVGNDAVILIQLDGGLIKRNGRGLVISASNCLVRGLAITGFQWDPASDPFFSRVLGGFGIQVLGSGTGNVIQGNFIGLTPDGVTPRANYVGVRVEGAFSVTGDNLVGGSLPAARNIISGNQSGAEAFGAATAFVGNYIGTDASGLKAVANTIGLKIGGPDAVIGGTEPGSGNVISGNQYDAIELGFVAGYHTVAAGNTAIIRGNLIGTKADGISPLGNGGTAVQVFRSSNSAIGGLEPGAGNVIAFNGRAVAISSSGTFGTGDSILSNAIYGNQSRGIILARPDSNNGQSFPMITSETISNGTATIRGTLQSAPNTEFTVQLFADSQSLTSSRQTYLGSVNVLTNGSGTGTFRVTYQLSNTNVIFNATATDPNGNTSEFSRHSGYLQNISTRAAVGSGDNVLIGGFIIQSGQVIIRGIGPSLKPYGFGSIVADPTLELHDRTGAEKDSNDNWRDNQYEAGFIEASGLAPTEDLEAAINLYAASQSYTAVFRGKGSSPAIGVVEAYSDIASDPNYGTGLNSGFANLSSRGFVGSGANVMIAGFIIGGGRGEDPRIVIRAMGPSLKAAGIANALPDPMVELHDGNGALLTSNDNWGDAQKEDLQAVELAPGDTAESAILVRLAAGAYTAVVRGKGDTSGIALVEVYALR